MTKREPYFKLKGWMVEHEISQRDIANALNTTSNNVNKKINGTGADFRLNEARQLVDEFHMPMSLFFDVKVPLKEHKLAKTNSGGDKEDMRYDGIFSNQTHC